MANDLDFLLDQKPEATVRTGTRSIGLFGFLILIALVTISPPVAAVVGVGLLPTVAAWLVAPNGDNRLVASVVGFNICGVLPIALSVWHDGGHSNAMLQAFADGQSWLIMYGSATIGWILYAGLPGAVERALRTRIATRIDNVETEQEELIREWGPDVDQRPRDARG